MNMTIFTCPKPFTNPHTRLIQMNAIMSWLQLRPQPEIMLMGDDDGVEDMAKEYALSHIGDIVKNQYGTPLVSDLFNKAQANATNDIVAYMNTDMIFGQDFVQAVELCSKKKHILMVGRRWNYDIRDPIQCNERARVDRLQADVYVAGEKGCITAMDYFVFRRGAVLDMPKFAVGRGGWDNWLLGYGVRKRWSVCDASEGVIAIHQNHAYEHVPAGTGQAWAGPETDQNYALIANREHIYRITDASFVLKDNTLQPARGPQYVYRRVERMHVVSPKLWKLVPSWKLKYALAWLFPRI